MSLDILMKTVSNETNFNYDDILGCLNELIERFGTNPFNDEDINNSVSALGILICEKLYANNLLNIVFKYTCSNTGGEEETDNLSNKCVYCKNVIHQKIKEHEVNRVYNYSRQHYDTIMEFISAENEKKYFMPELTRNIEDLAKDKNSIIPFLGAGVSTPFGLPNWEKLLLMFEELLSRDYHKAEYKERIEDGDFFGGLDYLIDKSLIISNKDQLKDEIIKIIFNANMGIDESKHNYFDFVELNSDFFITTNYDLLTENFLTAAESYNTPICMDEVGNLRNLSTTGNSVIHLHGHINKKSSMIVTKDDYTKLYSKKGTLVQLSAIIGSRPLLFIGYSFKDKFFVDMYEKLVKILQTNHYLVLFNPEPKEIKELNRMNVKVIGLSVSNGDYIKAIKVLVDFIKRK